MRWSGIQWSGTKGNAPFDARSPTLFRPKGVSRFFGTVCYQWLPMLSGQPSWWIRHLCHDMHNGHHGGHPVLRWCFQNVVIDEDPAGNVKLNKARSAEKIDGAVSAAMALGRATSEEIGPNRYDNERPEGFLTL